MKLKGVGCSVLMSVFCAATAQAGTMGPVAANLGKVYVGVFGGGGASTDVDVSQYGTAFNQPVVGGVLAVNAFGTAEGRSVGLVGGQVGYLWSDIMLSSFGLSPAVELEGYYLSKSSFTGQDLTNDTVFEHDFLTTYPTSAGVFLANAVGNLNLANAPRVHPYVGAGIGAAVLSIRGADALQTSPLEAGINHFNSNPNNSDAVFAGQIKAGLSYDFNENFSIFGEYRYLYLANSSFTFGSTVYATHQTTTNWSVEFASQNYNLGAVGLRYTV